MKRSILITFLSTVAFFIACDSEKEEARIMDDRVFYGEWCQISSDGYRIRDIIFEHLNYSEEQFFDKDQSDHHATVSGRWSFFAASDIIEMTGTRTWTDISAKEPVSETFVVLQQNEWLLELRNQSLGSIETFYKVVESKNLSINQNTNIDYLSSVSITATNYASSNPEIVKIESDNSITAVSSGIAYITITANVGKMIVKVIVK